MNPFSPLLTTVEFKSRIESDVSDTIAETFLVNAYKSFVSYGLPTKLNGTRSVQEESSISTQGGFDGDWSYSGGIKNTFIILNQPIYALTNVKIKDQTANTPTFSPELPSTIFQFSQYQKFIETSFYSFSGYKAQFWPMENYAKYVQVNYTTGVPTSAKDDFLEALFLIYLDIGFTGNADLSLNEGRITNERADDTSTTYDWSEVTTIKNYLDQNQDVASILEKYKSSSKHIF